MAAKRTLEYLGFKTPRIADVIERMVGKCLDALTLGEIQPSAGDLVRLIQLRMEMKSPESGARTATWSDGFEALPDAP